MNKMYVTIHLSRKTLPVGRLERAHEYVTSRVKFRPRRIGRGL